MKLRSTKAEKNWILYDVGNSAFVLLSATLLPIYFNSIAADAGIERCAVSGLLGLRRLGGHSGGGAAGDRRRERWRIQRATKSPSSA